jgi:Zn-dependent metalloprotease
MKKISVLFIFLLTIFSLVGCGNEETEEITKEQAEEIARDEFEKDLAQFNEKSNEDIEMDNVELLSDDTHLSSSSKAWEVTFNLKDGLTKDGEASNSIAQYSITPEGEVKSKSNSFE